MLSSHHTLFIQVGDGYVAFETVHKNMQKISHLSNEMPELIRTCVELALRGTPDAIDGHLQDSVQDLLQVANKCKDAADSCEAAFVNITSFSQVSLSFVTPFHRIWGLWVRLRKWFWRALAKFCVSSLLELQQHWLILPQVGATEQARAESELRMAELQDYEARKKEMAAEIRASVDMAKKVGPAFPVPSPRLMGAI
jgi:hypothetical protein